MSPYAIKIDIYTTDASVYKIVLMVIAFRVNVIHFIHYFCTETGWTPDITSTQIKLNTRKKKGYDIKIESTRMSVIIIILRPIYCSRLLLFFYLLGFFFVHNIPDAYIIQRSLFGFTIQTYIYFTIVQKY